VKNVYQEVQRLMQARDWAAAETACKYLNSQYPEFAAGWLAASQIAGAIGSSGLALDAIDRALTLDPHNPTFLIRRARCLLAAGRRLDALDVADAAGRRAPMDPKIWDAIGTLKSYANNEERALEAYDRAVAIAPQDPQFAYNRAAVRRFLGNLEGAESDYDHVIARRPRDYEAYLNRSDLRVQTPASNHVKELEDVAARHIADWRGEVQIRFALAKEYEDLGEYAKSFEQLQIGAKTRRTHMKYDVGTDVATVDWIISAFPSVPAERAPNDSPDAPIFILGLPRSGTTLVERILSSHSLVTSAGELNCLSLAIVDAVRRRTECEKIPRQVLIARSASLDFAELGYEYLRRARLVVGGAARFIDKMPLNYLYCGLIRRALPHAKIVHVKRQPVAVCYAMYKTLLEVVPVFKTRV
jgi:tetratricopeptide (TPR) repeat protein